MLVVCAVACMGMADTVVTDTLAAQTYGTDTVLVPETVAADSLPDVGTPIFWFDCSDRAGWTIDPDTKAVTYIPSKTGDGRSLATAFTVPGNWTGWSGGSVAPLGPVLVEDVEELQGGALLDFGEQGSGRGLIFNPLGSTATSLYPGGSNVLENIGTVVAIYDSAKGGGFLLGGGYGQNTVGYDANGRHYQRGTSHSQASTGNKSSYREPTLRVVDNNDWSVPNATQAINGVVWQNGIPTTPHFTGFSGGWEILSFEPRSYKGSPGLLPQATGIGINDTRSEYRESSGGMRIAEMVIYGKVLTADERKKVEAYLVKKWFGKSIRGYNGNARISDVRLWNNAIVTGATPNMTVTAEEDENLTIERLHGGRGSSSASARKATLVKEGAGTLTLGNAQESGLDVELREGTLAFERRAMPTNLPWGVLFHVDASKLETLERETVGGVQYVSRWDAVEQLPLTGYETRLCSTSIVDVASRPWLIPDVFGPGMGVVDFGAFGSGRCFRFVRKNAVEPIARYRGITTVIAVVGAQEGGGNLMEDNGDSAMGYFFRGKSGVKFDTALLPASTAHVAVHPTLKPSDGVVFVDGVRSAPSAGYPDPGYHLLAIQTAGSQASTVGGSAYGAARCGGIRIAELVIYDRVLTEREFMDAQAYLNAKWFKRQTPGYAAPEGVAAVGESRAVVLENDAAIEVSGTGAAAPDGFSSPKRSSLVKKGDGTLLLPKGAAMGEVDVRGGEIRFVDGFATNATGMAANPVFHLDATALNTMDFESENGTNFVRRWYDGSFNNMAMRTTAGIEHLPWLTTAAADLDGLAAANAAAVDFGVTNGCSLNFARPVDAIRAAFVVWRPGTQYSSLLGSSGSNIDYCRRVGYGARNPLFLAHDSLYSVRNGLVLEDGVKIASPTATAPSDGWHLIEVYPKTPNHASALCAGRGNVTEIGYGNGGSRYAEIILYTRELSDLERTATRNYLRAKWFGAEPEPLPEVGASKVDVSILRVSGESAMSADCDMAANLAEGEGTLVKTGAGELAVDDISSLTGRISVAEGSLRLTLPAPDGEGEFISDGLVLHLDASTGVTTELDSQTLVPRVTRWDDASGNGWYAVPGQYGMTANPTFVAKARAGLPAVNLSTNEHQYMVFMNPEGVRAAVTNIRSVVWVMNTEEGGGMLLGGGYNYADNKPTERWNFHRGTDYRVPGEPTNRTVSAEFKTDCALLSYNGQANLRGSGSKWRVNGSEVSPTSRGVLSGGWDMISFAMNSDAENATEAEALACDGRTISNSSATTYLRSGGQCIGEILVYSNALTSAQIVGLETYLKKKWGFVRASDTNLAEVAVAEGAELDLSGTSQYLSGISGAGVVSNGALAVGSVDSSEGLLVDGDLTMADGSVWSVTVGPDGCETLSVDGTLTFGQNLTIALSGLEGRQDLRDKTFTIASAGTIAGAENARTATVLTPGMPSSLRAAVSVSGNTVKVRFSSLGMIFTVY